MADDLTELLNDQVYDIERVLKNALAKVSEDLLSGDEQKEKIAAKDVSDILDWFVRCREFHRPRRVCP